MLEVSDLGKRLTSAGGYRMTDPHDPPSARPKSSNQEPSVKPDKNDQENKLRLFLVSWMAVIMLLIVIVFAITRDATILVQSHQR